MRPFKKGDKVRIVACSYGHREAVDNTIWVIRAKYGENTPCNYALEGSNWYFGRSELELAYNFRDYEKAVNNITI